MDMTDAFLAFPLCVPGTAVWKGRQGRLFIIKVRSALGVRACFSDGLIGAWVVACFVLCVSRWLGCVCWPCWCSYATMCLPTSKASPTAATPLAHMCLPSVCCMRAQVLTRAAAQSKAKMATGAEPECLLDFWSQQVLQEIKEAKEAGQEPPFYCADAKMADSVMDFLFASQVGLMEAWPHITATSEAAHHEPAGQGPLQKLLCIVAVVATLNPGYLEWPASATCNISAAHLCTSPRSRYGYQCVCVLHGVAAGCVHRVPGVAAHPDGGAP